MTPNTIMTFIADTRVIFHLHVRFVLLDLRTLCDCVIHPIFNVLDFYSVKNYIYFRLGLRSEL